MQQNATQLVMSQILDTPSEHGNNLKASWCDTPLGPMITISDENTLYLLEFLETRDLEAEIKRLKQKTKSSIIQGVTEAHQQIEKELRLYFNGQLKEFKTATVLLGTPFQKQVWQELRKIPFGETRSYAELATAIGNKSAFRAVARANSTNQLAIVIPCHRVINSSGELGGYAGGVTRKSWLLNHESKPHNSK